MLPTTKDNPRLTIATPVPSAPLLLELVLVVVLVATAPLTELVPVPVADDDAAEVAGATEARFAIVFHVAAVLASVDALL